MVPRDDADALRDEPVRPGKPIAPSVAETVAHPGPHSPPLGGPAAAGVAPIGDRFRKVGRHARGGLGEIFLAVDPQLDRQVALKELREHLAHDPASQARFLFEARLTGRLEHPGIVPVYGLGRHPDGRPYYAMRFIEGETLGRAIERFHAEESAAPGASRREIAFRRLLRSLIDACNAVAYAHSRGVVHRDLKPDNIMLGRFGETLVVDWGLAKSLEPGELDQPVDSSRTIPPQAEDPAFLTRPGAALGTPQYMSPEQASGALDRVGPASDVYGLGATLYYLLVGQGPFADGSADVADVLDRVRRGIFPSPRQVRRSIDPALEASCMKAMALDPAERHATPTALAEEIEAWLADVRYRAEHDQALADVGRTLARLAIERAGRLLERGMLDEGMLWLSRALENVPADSPGLDLAIRAGLGGWHAGGRPLQRTLPHRDAVQAIAFSPDGRRVLTACADQTARLWDVATAAPLAPPMEHRAAIRAVAFSSGGRTAAVLCADGSLRLWDAVTGKPVGSVVHVEVPADAAVRFSAEGTFLAVAYPGGGVICWDVATAAPSGPRIQHEAPVCGLVLAPDGRRLLGACRDGRVRIWDTSAGSLLAELSHGDQVGCVAFSPDGQVLASACSGGMVRLWDGESARPIGEPLLHRGPIDCLAFHSDGMTLATGGRDGTARLWDARSGLALGPPLEHRGAVLALAFSPDGRRLATASTDCSARFWRVPQPVAGDRERVSCWVRATTGRAFDAGDAIRPLDSQDLWELRRRLQHLGGPPVR